MIPKASMLLSKLRGSPRPATHLWVIGCPRSGTTYLTKVLGRNADLVLDEPNHIPMYARDKVEEWTFPKRRTIVFKWCENWVVAKRILARFPNSYFLHTVRDPSNTVHSIAFPKPDSRPPRPFPELGGDGSDRIHKAIEKWFHYTRGCLSVERIAPERYLCVPYEDMPAHFPHVEALCGIELSDRPPFTNRDLPDEALAHLESAWASHPAESRLAENVRTMLRGLSEKALASSTG